MRVLKPEIAEERKGKILKTVIQKFIESRKPVSSDIIARKSGLKVSPATIRNIMKDLEDEGFLYQSHISGGRVPTDKAYRFYVNYIADLQKFAIAEKQKIEEEYHNRLDEADKLLAHTSKTLAEISRSAGFVLTSNICEQKVKRIDFVPLGVNSMLAILVSESGIIHHWPVKLRMPIQRQKLRLIGEFLNYQTAGLPINEAKRKLSEYINSGHNEFRDAADIALKFFDDIQQDSSAQNELYIEGMGQLMSNYGEDREFFDIIRVMEEKQKFAGVLNEILKEHSKNAGVRVSIGAENEMKELKGFSIISGAYKTGGNALGILGIIAPRHIEYGKMMSLVKFMTEMVENSMDRWDDIVSVPRALDYDE